MTKSFRPVPGPFIFVQQLALLCFQYTPASALYTTYKKAKNIPACKCIFCTSQYCSFCIIHTVLFIFRLAILIATRVFVTKLLRHNIKFVKETL
nr:MAG TPA: hypothetical protein [Caudoviricetes sp.]